MRSPSTGMGVKPEKAFDRLLSKITNVNTLFVHVDNACEGKIDDSDDDEEFFEAYKKPAGGVLLGVQHL